MQHIGKTCGTMLCLGLWCLSGCDSQVDSSYAGEALSTLTGRVVNSSDVSAADVGVLWLTSSPGDKCSGPTYQCSSVGYASASATTQVCIDNCGPQPDCADDAAIQTWEPCMFACGITDAKVEYKSDISLCSSNSVGQTVPVTGDFPAKFKLELLVEPPTEALLPDDQGARVAVARIIALVPGTKNVTADNIDDAPPDWLLGGVETHVLVYAADAVEAGSGWATLLGGPLSVGYHLIETVPGNDCPVDGVVSYGEGEIPGGLTLDDYPFTDEQWAVYYGASTSLCGNGVCENDGVVIAETCDNCSDCGCSESESSPTSTGIIKSASSDYFCVNSEPSVIEAPSGFDTEISLRLTTDGSINWPNL